MCPDFSLATPFCVAWPWAESVLSSPVSMKNTQSVNRDGELSAHDQGSVQGCDLVGLHVRTML